jgi:glucosamine--fructose-6-phosphate aminotransferase (isomerizing)
MTNNATHMRIEIEEIPEAARRLLSGSADALLQAGLALRQSQPGGC